MSQNPEELKLRATLGALEQGRRELVELADGLLEDLNAIERDLYLTPEEKKLRAARARDEAGSAVTGKHKAALKAHEDLRAAKDEVLNRHKPSAQAQATVRHLLAQGAGLGDIVERAIELGDVELVVAARSEAKLIPKPTRRDGEAWLESEALTDRLDLALAEVIPGSERELLPQAIKLSRDPVVQPAAELAVKAIHNPADTAMARITLAYAQSDAGLGDGADSGGGEGGAGE